VSKMFGHHGKILSNIRYLQGARGRYKLTLGLARRLPILVFALNRGFGDK
jgi:hypothetical protein